VPGGGVALLRGAAALDKLAKGGKLDEDERLAVEIIRRACEEPIRWIAHNAATETYEDMVKAGVIDPTKVVRSALQNAASIAGLLLTTEALVSELPEEKKPAAPMPNHGMEY